MATTTYAVRDPNDKSIILGYFDAEEGTPPEQLKEMAALRRTELLREAHPPPIFELSKPNLSRKALCSHCPREPAVYLDMDTDEFHKHMQMHNREKNLGEDI
jgi:hypothetical protein